MAGRSNTTLGIDITADNSKAKPALKDTAKELGGVESAAKKTSTATSGVHDALKGLAVLGAGKFVLDEFDQAQTTAAKTAAVIKSTGNAAEVTAGQQDQMVNSLSDLAAVDDEVVAGGANILRTFDNIKGTDVFEGALNSAQDLVAVFGGDLQDKANTLGRALQDPEKGLTRLARLGVTFSEGERDQVKSMVAVNDTAGAQKVILESLERQYGGQAEAAVTSGQKTKVAFANAAESLGTSLAPAIGATAKATEGLASTFQAFPPVVQTGIVALTGLGVAGAKVSEKFGEDGLSGSLGKSVSEVGKLESAVTAGVAGLAAYGTAMEFLNKQVEFKGDTSGLARDIDQLGRGVATVDEVLANFATSGDQGDPFRPQREGVQNLAAAFNELKDTSFSPSDLLGIDDKRAGNTLAALDAGLASLAQTNAPAARKAVGELSAKLLEQGVTADQIAAALPNYYGELERSERENRSTKEAVDDTNKSFTDQVSAIVSAAAAQTQLQADAAKARDDLVAERDAREAVSKAHDTTTEAVQALAEAQRAATGDSDEYRSAQQAIADAEQGVEDAQRTATEAQQKLNDARAEAKKRIVDMAEAAREARDAEAEALQTAAEKAEANRLAQGNTQLSDLEKKRAALDARLAADDASDKGRDAAQAEQDAAQATVENDKAVVAAKQDVADAERGIQDAVDRRSSAERAAAKVISDAKDEVSGAAKRVEDAVGAEATAWDNLATLTGSATDGIRAHSSALLSLTAQLDPNSPLRSRLRDYAAELFAISGGPEVASIVQAAAIATAATAGVAKPRSGLGAGGVSLTINAMGTSQQQKRGIVNAAVDVADKIAKGAM